jgi:3-hydroxyacyl-[acyl-carrier-protein] dehydratase
MIIKGIPSDHRKTNYKQMKQEAFDQLFQISILSQGEHESILVVKVLRDSEVFEGHFPGNPILPGVMMVEAVRASLNLLFPAEFQLKSALTIKFLSVLNPDEFTEVHLGIKHAEVEEGLKIEANLYFGDKTFFKMKAVYQAI